MGFLDRFRRRTAWTAFANDRRWETPADPWSLLHVAPTRPDRWNVCSLLWGLGRIQAGDWDEPTETTKLSETPMVEGLRQRFEDDRPWTETAYYEHARERLNAGDSYAGVDSVETLLEERFPEIDALYASIRHDGYRPNSGIVYDDPTDVERIHELEPMVLIGRDGEIIWTEGFHRLVLAAIAGVETIPVYVLQRHTAWQQIRERAADGEVTRYDDHPDIRAL